MGEGNPLLIQNRDQTLFGFLEKRLNKEMYTEIFDAVKNRGWKGSKAGHNKRFKPQTRFPDYFRISQTTLTL